MTGAVWAEARPARIEKMENERKVFMLRAEVRKLMEPSGEKPDRVDQRQARAPPGNEQDLAERRTATGRQAVEHISHRGHRLDEAFFRSKKQWRANEAGAAGAIFNTVTEKSDRAPVIDVAGVSVEGRVKLRTGGQQTDYPDAQRAK